MIYTVNTREIGERIAIKLKKEYDEENETCGEVSWDYAEELIEEALIDIRGGILNVVCEKLEKKGLELM